MKILMVIVNSNEQRVHATQHTIIFTAKEISPKLKKLIN